MVECTGGSLATWKTGEWLSFLEQRRVFGYLEHWRVVECIGGSLLPESWKVVELPRNWKMAEFPGALKGRLSYLKTRGGYQGNLPGALEGGGVEGVEGAAGLKPRLASHADQVDGRVTLNYKYR